MFEFKKYLLDGSNHFIIFCIIRTKKENRFQENYFLLVFNHCFTIHISVEMSNMKIMTNMLATLFVTMMMATLALAMGNEEDAYTSMSSGMYITLGTLLVILSYGNSVLSY